MTPWPGALTITAILYLAVAAIWQTLRWRRRAELWDRLVRVCGSEASAVRVLTAAEAIPAEVRSETLMAMGMEGANKRGWIR